MHLLKRKVISYVTDQSMVSSFSQHQQLPMKSANRVDICTHCNANPAERDTDNANGEEKIVSNDILAAVHYKLSTNKESQKQQHAHIRQYKTTEHMVGWQKEVIIQVKYQT